MRNKKIAASPEGKCSIHTDITESELPNLLVLALFALLVCNTAGSLARGLAGSLAFAAAAVLEALSHIAGVQSLNVLHEISPLL